MYGDEYFYGRYYGGRAPMRQMQIGQPVDVIADLYGGKVHYQGRI